MDEYNNTQIVDFMLSSGVTAEGFVEAINNPKLFDLLLGRVKKAREEALQTSWNTQEESRQLEIRKENIEKREKNLDSLETRLAESLNDRSRLLKEVEKLKRKLLDVEGK